MRLTSSVEVKAERHSRRPKSGPSNFYSAQADNAGLCATVHSAVRLAAFLAQRRSRQANDRGAWCGRLAGRAGAGHLHPLGTTTPGSACSGEPDGAIDDRDQARSRPSAHPPPAATKAWSAAPAGRGLPHPQLDPPACSRTRFLRSDADRAAIAVISDHLNLGHEPPAFAIKADTQDLRARKGRALHPQCHGRTWYTRTCSISIVTGKMASSTAPPSVPPMAMFSSRYCGASKGQVARPARGFG